MKPSCRCGAEAIARGLCRPCYDYERKMGKPRPFSLIVRHNLRRENREAEERTTLVALLAVLRRRAS